MLEFFILIIYCEEKALFRGAPNREILFHLKTKEYNYTFLN